MSCNLNDIVTLGLCPDEGLGLSGLRLIDAAGISSKILANIANETYVQGANLAMEKKRVALIKFRNDFIGAMQSNRVVTTIVDPIYPAADFNTSLDVGTYAGDRGVVLHKNTNYRGTLRQTIINSIECYPLQSGDGTIKLIVEKNGYVNEYSWEVTFVADQVNIFGAEQFSEFPFILPPEAKSAKVLVDQTDISFCSTVITCLKGCSGSLPNECGWVDGWDGAKAVKDEGYGVNINFLCHCNYEQILCDLSKSYSGELIFLKWQIEIFDEEYKTNRFNNWVIYNRSELPGIIADLNNQYATKWNNMMSGMLGILNAYKDQCLNCRNIRWVVNV